MQQIQQEWRASDGTVVLVQVQGRWVVPHYIWRQWLQSKLIRVKSSTK